MAADDYVRQLTTELAYCEETGNPRADQVRDALAAAGHPVDTPAPPRPAGRGRGRRETAEDKTPKERA